MLRRAGCFPGRDRSLRCGIRAIDSLDNNQGITLHAEHRSLIHLYHHNDLTRLAALLQGLMRSERPASPLAPETVLVPNRGHAQWLQRVLAEHDGIVANVRFPLPAGFIWGDLIRDTLGWSGHQEYLRERMVWHLYRLLPALRPEVAAIHRYLATEPAEVHRIQLAERLADIFDQYQVFRGDLLARWDRGEEDSHSATEAWQAPVWRRLVEVLGPEHRAYTLRQACRSLAEGQSRAKLPAGRLFCFGIADLPPDYLRLLYALGRQCEIHLLLPNPSGDYWGDIAAQPVSLAFPVEDAELPTQAALEQGHPLLASMARPIRDFIHLLYSDELAAIQESDLGEVLEYTAPAGEHLLARIQRGVVALDPAAGAGAVAEDDVSVQIHACPGRLREVQILHDQLLDLLARHDDLEPRDIIVMMPDVAEYAPAIRSVFGGAGEDCFIPWSLSDQPRYSSHPIVQTFLDVLDLPLSRWNASHIMTLAAVPAIMRRFGLDETDLERLRVWIARAGIRWGRDRAHRRRQGAGDYDEYSWTFGLDRLLLGTALADDEALVDDVVPWPELEGREAEGLGRLHHLVEILAGWEAALDADRTPLAWRRLLNELVASLFTPDPEDPAEGAALEAVHEALALLDTAHHCMPETPLTWAALREKLRDALAEAGERQPLLTGGITFCGLHSLAGVPARVVCLLGMDDGAFPRQDGGRAFNLLLQRRALGDRSNRDKDRLAFLQALLAAQDVFYVSYTGMDVQTGERLHPAPTVGELLTFLDACHFPGAGRDAPAGLVTRQPMQPFSRRYFDEEEHTPRIFTFREAWTTGARTTPKAGAEPPPLADSSRAPAPDVPIIELAALHRFFRHPPKEFLQERLGLRLSDGEEYLSDDEPFKLDGLGAWQLRAALLQEIRATGNPVPEASPPRPWARRGLLPPGRLAAEAWAPEARRVNALLPLVRAWEGGTAPVDVDRMLPGGERLSGRVADRHPAGLRRIHAGELKMKHCLADWLDYLALLAADELPAGADLMIAGTVKDREAPEIRRAVATPDEARGLLDRLAAHYRDGITRPLPFLPDLAGDYLADLDSGITESGKPAAQAAAEALAGLNSKLHPDVNKPRHEVFDEALMRVLAPSPHPLGETPAQSEFVELAERICRVLYDRLEPITADAAGTAADCGDTP